MCLNMNLLASTILHTHTTTALGKSRRRHFIICSWAFIEFCCVVAIMESFCSTEFSASTPNEHSFDQNVADQRPPTQTLHQLRSSQRSQPRNRSRATNKKKKNDQKHYNIEKILEAKKERNRIMYLIKWSGFDDRHNSWIDIRSFAHPDLMLHEFYLNMLK